MSEPVDPKAPKAPPGATPADPPAAAPKSPSSPVLAASPKAARDPAAEAAALAMFEADEAAASAPPKPAAPAPTDPAPAASPKEEQKEAKEPKPRDAKPEAKKAEPAKKPVVAEKVEPVEDLDRPPTAPPWWKRLRADPPAGIRIALGFGLIALLFFVWWFLTHGSDPTSRIVSPSKLPSPGEVFGALGKLFKADFVDSLIDSLIRVFKGIGLAALVGIGLGVLASSNRGVGSALEPLVIFLRSVPMGALIPLTLLLFGDGEQQKSMFIFLAVVPFVFSDTVKAVSIVPERYVETAQTLGASRFQIVTKVLVPLAMPDIITSLRFLLGLALGYIMLVEVVNTPHGLGTMLNTSQRLGMSEQIYLLLFVIALVAFGLDLILRTIQRGVFSWRKDL